MRRIYLPILFLGLLISCNADQDFIDTVQAYDQDTSPQGEDEETGDSEDPDDPEVPDVDLPPIVDFEGQLEINTTPCEYTLEVLEANGNLAVDCTIDLDGQTIELPSNVTLEYTGGQIINGTLNFSGGTIDGKLMNKDLTLTGDVALSSDVFQLHPERWELVQGNTTSNIALDNTANLETLFELTKSLGANTFLIDEFDAYFEVTKVTSTTSNQNFYPSIEAVNLPSNFNLVMTNKTHLRTYPNSADNGVLLAFREVSNSSVKGGVLHGDREEHNYGGSSGEGGNHIMSIHAATNILIDGVKLVEGSKGGIHINALRFAFQPDYLPSHDIVVRNCTFERNRRMAVALTDGHNILFDNNSFIDTAQESPNSNGGVVGFAINIEPVRKRENGVLVYYERAYDITIRNNTERGSRVGAFNIYLGDNIIIENNSVESKVNWSYAKNSKVRNNTFVASSATAGTPAITAGGSGETVLNNEISGNNISGYGLAIAAFHGELKIFDNLLEDNTTGIQLKDIKNAEVKNNRIISSGSSSRGLNLHLTAADNVLFDGNEIDVVKDQIYCVSFNRDAGEENNRLIMTNNKFMSDTKLTFSDANGIEFNGNEVVGGLQLINTENIDVTANTISANSSHGIHLRDNNFDVQIGDNAIGVPINGNFECIKNDSGGQVSIQQNTCQD